MAINIGNVLHDANVLVTIGAFAYLGLIVITFVMSALEDLTREHPIVTKIGVLCFTVPLWCLSSGTWLAGVLGIISLFIFASLFQRKRIRS